MKSAAKARSCTDIADRLLALTRTNGGEWALFIAVDTPPLYVPYRPLGLTLFARIYARQPDSLIGVYNQRAQPEMIAADIAEALAC